MTTTKTTKTPVTDLHEALNKLYDEYDLRASIVDALTDLRHLCDAHDIDFDYADSIAQYHYNVEVTGR